ncbi:hypothetical protein Pan216_37650 [Planctomycetes bacterium Pan216]|uniref:Transcription termination/antitermination protein NusA n=1 Tax=Kolteria novifilia TaxID=2527975 RepID=A0A518B7F7_9BACT|nr:hypothetical protein Pan216_37650 [Planctomycetes bacterium Pan216]
MNAELLRIVDSIHRDKNIDQEIVFNGIESAYMTAARKYYGEESDIEVVIDRESGAITATHDGSPITAEELGRIAAQSAKQIMIQKIREAERDALYDEFRQERGTIFTGVVQRAEGSVVTVNIGKAEALLPRSEQMPGETFRPGERVRAVLIEVRKSGQRVKLILSRTHPDFVRRLFEQEIPEIAEHIIEMRAIAREAGYRTKVAVSSIDSKVDCVGACVGVRGSRIKNVLDELNGERIDIIRFNESNQVMIPNALAPAQIEEVQIYMRMGRAIVLVREDQLSLAIGKRGQNVRLASKLVGVDIEIMTFDELTEEIERAEATLSELPDVSEDVIDSLIEEGILSFDDLSVIEVEQIMEVTGLVESEAARIVGFAEMKAEEAPQESSSRSSMLSAPSASPTSSPSSSSGSSSEEPRAEGLLEETRPQEARVPSVDDLFGGDPTPEKQEDEKKITAAQLFGDDKPSEEPETASESPSNTEEAPEDSPAS